MKRLLVAALCVLAGLYVAVLAFFFFAQGAILFPAPRGARPPHGPLLYGDGFVALWEPPPSAQAPVVVFFHGNGEDLADAGAMVELLRGLGAGVLAVEYPGYGVAPGKRGEKPAYAAGTAAVRHLRDVLGVSPERIVLLGHSLGTAVAAELASQGLGARVVLLSPFTSAADVGRSVFPWVPVGLLLRHRFASASKAPRIGQPVLVIHGTDDEVVPFRMGEELSRLLPHATFVPVPGGHHNDLVAVHRAQLCAALEAFLAPKH